MTSKGLLARSNLKRAMRHAWMRPLPRLPARTSVDLRAKRVLLRGASSGIGAVAADKLAAQGATVIFVAYRYAPAEKIGPFIYSVIIFTALMAVRAKTTAPQTVVTRQVERERRT